MLTVRKVALKVLPLLVVAWATLAIVGGAAHLLISAYIPKALIPAA